MDEEERDAQSGEVSSLGYHIVPDDDAQDTWTLSDLQHQVGAHSLYVVTNWSPCAQHNSTQHHATRKHANLGHRERRIATCTTRSKKKRLALSYGLKATVL